jgi:hypothetical protein
LFSFANTDIDGPLRATTFGDWIETLRLAMEVACDSLQNGEQPTFRFANSKSRSKTRIRDAGTALYDGVQYLLETVVADSQEVDIRRYKRRDQAILQVDTRAFPERRRPLPLSPTLSYVHLSFSSHTPSFTEWSES